MREWITKGQGPPSAVCTLLGSHIHGDRDWLCLVTALPVPLIENYPLTGVVTRADRCVPPLPAPPGHPLRIFFLHFHSKSWRRVKVVPVRALARGLIPTQSPREGAVACRRLRLGTLRLLQRHPGTRGLQGKGTLSWGRWDGAGTAPAPGWECKARPRQGSRGQVGDTKPHSGQSAGGGLESRGVIPGTSRPPLTTPPSRGSAGRALRPPNQRPPFTPQCC